MNKMLVLYNKTCEMQWIVVDFCARLSQSSRRACLCSEVQPWTLAVVWRVLIIKSMKCQSESKHICFAHLNQRRLMATTGGRGGGVEERMNSCGRRCAHKDDESDWDYPPGNNQILFRRNVRQKRGSCCPCPVAQSHHNTAHLSRAVHTPSPAQAAPTRLQDKKRGKMHRLAKVGAHFHKAGLTNSESKPEL